MSRLSVIIPGYNTPDAWWRRCVLSVLATIGDDDEIICIDDGSSVQPDLAGIRNLDSRIRVICLKQNVGQAAARNVALDVAQGRYVTFVDSDDEVMAGVYEQTLSHMEKTQSGVGVFGVRVVWTEEGLIKNDVLPSKEYGCLSPVDLKCLYDACLFNYACNKVYDVNLITSARTTWNLRFDVGGMPCEDLVFNLQAAMVNVKWCSINVVGYVYYRTGGSSLSRYKPTNGIGNRLAAHVWAKYCEMRSCDSQMFAKERHWTDFRQASSDWANMWMPGTPYGIRERYRWLRQHRELGGVRFFVTTLIKRMLRKYFYFRPIRRWHIRRLYPQVEECR